MEKHLAELKELKQLEMQKASDVQMIFQAQGYLNLIRELESLPDILKNQPKE